MRNWASVLLLAGITWLAQAQTVPPPEAVAMPAADKRQDDDRGVGLKSLPRDIFEDQGALFTMPLRMGQRQWKLGVPFSAVAAGLIASDTAVEGHVTRTPATVSHASTFSNAGMGALVAVGGGMYLWGSFAKNEHAREAGFLSGEAAIDAYLDTSLIQYAAGRNRPFTGNGRGNFFSSGGAGSFPSQHSAISWAVASVIAHEYPGPLTKLLSYGLAGAVSVARVEAHDHFMSDTVIGGALGWYIGRQVYRARSSDADIDVRKWGKFERDENSEQEQVTSQMGSSYVPLDSWMYAVIERLEAMGYITTGSAMVRPWTRLECARLLAEAHEKMDAGNLVESDSIAAPLLDALDEELSHENDLRDGGRNTGMQVESLYARFTGIAGTPLRDSFHFAQTLVDDGGRPYGQGANGIGGISARAEAGPLAFYLRGEYQYASALPSYSATAQQAIAASDGLPYGWNLRLGTTSRARPVEAYAAVNSSNWQLSFGQQSLWLGPDKSTSMILSNNAEAMPMLRLERVSPLALPGFLQGLGAVRTDFFLAREGGVHFVRLGPDFVLNGSASQPLDPPPYMWGVSIAIKHSESFEFGFAHTTIFAGYGRPLNLKTFLHTFSLEGNAQAVDPGKRTTEFNFSCHVPGIRKWLVLYSEGFAYDAPNPGKFGQRFAMDPGIYLPQFPGLRGMDFRVEGFTTNLPGLEFPAYFYANQHYPQGYTNYGQILGSWIGRQGSGVAATGTYWFSARNKASASYRKTVADKSFLEGGDLEDFSGSITWMLRPGIEFSATSQYERWNFPLLAATARTDVATSFGIRLFPKTRLGSEDQGRESGAGAARK